MRFGANPDVKVALIGLLGDRGRFARGLFFSQEFWEWRRKSEPKKVSMVGVTVNNELLYLIIGILVGLILGINFSTLLNRFFSGRNNREQQLRRRISELEQRLVAKDRYIGEAIKAAQKEAEKA